LRSNSNALRPDHDQRPDRDQDGGIAYCDSNLIDLPLIDGTRVVHSKTIGDMRHKSIGIPLSKIHSNEAVGDVPARKLGVPGSSVTACAATFTAPGGWH
jgi:hypothetical protein